MFFPNDNKLSENNGNHIVSTNTNLIDSVFKEHRNLQNLPFESICAGDQTINCGNNGKCISLPNVDNQKQFLCVCSDGFTGPKCETGEFPAKSEILVFSNFLFYIIITSLGCLYEFRPHFSLFKWWNLY